MANSIAIDGHAGKTKGTFDLEYSVGIHIQAKPELVWGLLTNAADFPRWNSTIKSLEGKITLGETIRLVAMIAPTRTFNLKVVEFEPGKRMVWSEGNFMFKGVRTYTVAAGSNGSSDFTMLEAYSGVMLPMIAGSLPDFRPPFEQYAADLKREAERA